MHRIKGNRWKKGGGAKKKTCIKMYFYYILSSSIAEDKRTNPRPNNIPMRNTFILKTCSLPHKHVSGNTG